jgi:hypothetical protein
VTGLPWHYVVEDRKGQRFKYPVSEVKKAVDLAMTQGLALFRVGDDGTTDRLLAPKPKGAP